MECMANWFKMRIIMVQKVNGNGLKVNKMAHGQILLKGPKILQLEDMYTKATICQPIESQTRCQNSMESMKSQPYANKVKLGQGWS